MRFGAGMSILENELPGSCNGRYCACKSYLTKKKNYVNYVNHLGLVSHIDGLVQERRDSSALH